MLFNSAIFIVLFFFLYLVYWHLGTRGKQNLIIVGSILFYAWYSVPFLLVFLALIVINHRIAMILIRRKSKTLLWSAITLDAGLLIFFKYFYMLAQSAGVLLGVEYLANLEANWVRDHNFQIALPIAISFYTFQIIAFVVDAYRGNITEYVESRKFYLFILFFPQFVAGPIMRASDFLPQIDRPVGDRDRILGGSMLLLQGIIKKVLLADRLGSYTAAIWQNPDQYDALFLVLIMPAFIAQVYLDFSGYTDMARGLAKGLGYEIPENFRGPFFATSMQDLWQRWHITLSTWLRDYIYIPLGGSRLGPIRTNVNLLITMSVGGLWHGASWTFVIWGFYLGVILVMERTLRVNNIRLLPEGRLFDGVRILLTFSLFSFSGLFFASPSMENVFAILEGIFTLQRANPAPEPGGIVAITLIALLFNWFQYNPERWEARLQKIPSLRYAMVPVGVFFTGFMIALFGDISGMFIYFQF